jgi:hypothetical protein
MRQSYEIKYEQSETNQVRTVYQSGDNKEEAANKAQEWIDDRKGGGQIISVKGKE